MFSEVDINEAIRTAVALSEPRWKAQAQAAGGPVLLKTDLHEVPSVDGHASDLWDVLMNLIFNAVDAMPQGGTLSIATELRASAEPGARHGRGHGRRDAAGRAPGCLEPFFTTKGELGTGMGLAMTYGIIQRHRGTIDIETQPGEGTTFRIRLPACVDRSASPEQAPADAASRLLRILVVENEPAPRQVIVEYLQRDGHVVETALDGRDGLERFQGGSFDVVVTDRAMPEIDGLELAAAIGPDRRPETGRDHAERIRR